MKKNIWGKAGLVRSVFLMLGIFLVLPCWADVLADAQKLVTEHKYATAYDLLVKADKENTSANIVLMKADIALNYFVQSINHRAFSFKDIPQDKSIYDYRGQPGSSDMYAFEIDTALKNLIERNPQDMRLYKQLGIFYYDAQSKYGDKWTKPTRETLALAEENLTKIDDTPYADAYVYFILGYINLYQEKYDKAAMYLERSVSLDKKYAAAQYNLAYAYMYLNKHEQAITCAKIAYDNYTDPPLKADAARMVATLYSELKKQDQALAYYEKSYALDKKNYYTLKPFLFILVARGDMRAKAIREEFIALAPDNPTIYNDLLAIYATPEQQKALLAFLEQQQTQYAKDPAAVGTMYFYQGVLYREMKLPDKAKPAFLKAKDILSAVYKPDHPVFGVIDQALKDL